MNKFRIAARLVEARRKSDRRPAKVSRPETMLKPSTEFSCRMEISLSADFEGDVAKKDLVKKLKNEVIASIKSGMEQVAKDLEIHGTGIVISPLRVECAVNDQTDIEDESEITPDEGDFVESDPEPTSKRRRR